jgi:hypothetical protein
VIPLFRAVDGNDDFVEDNPRDHHLGVEKAEKLKVARTAEIDQGSRVGNDDHTAS